MSIWKSKPGGDFMSKQKAGHPGMNATNSGGKEAAFNNEMPAQRTTNRSTKTKQ